MEGRKAIIALAIMLALFALVVVAINSYPYVEYNPKQPEHISRSVRVWAVVDSNIWESYSDLRVNTMFPTINFTIENRGTGDIHNISFDYVRNSGKENTIEDNTASLERATYLFGDLLAGETKTFSLTEIRLRDYVGHPKTTLDFQCDELPKDRNYNAAAFGVIFLEFYWQPEETHSNEEAFSF